MSPSVKDTDGKTIDNPENVNSSLQITDIHFDVATTVGTVEDKGGKGGLDIKVFAASLGNNSTLSLENVSRLTFSIPVVLPTTTLKTKEEMLLKKGLKRVPPNTSPNIPQ